MKKLTLNIYDDTGKLTRVAEGDVPHIKFGVIRSLMEVLNISDTTTSIELLEKVYGAWDKLTDLLGMIFPDVTQDEWDNVDVSELISLLFIIFKACIIKMNTIPTDPKNFLGA